MGNVVRMSHQVKNCDVDENFWTCFALERCLCCRAGANMENEDYSAAIRLFIVNVPIIHA